MRNENGQFYSTTVIAMSLFYCTVHQNDQPTAQWGTVAPSGNGYTNHTIDKEETYNHISLGKKIHLLLLLIGSLYRTAA